MLDKKEEIDEVQFYEGCQYQDKLGQIWIAKMKDGKKYLWKNDTGWGSWNYGKGLIYLRRSLT
jgi:hypothetical protein